jgi:hypothetical protein
MVRFRAQIFAVVASVLACGCASKNVDTPPNLVSDIPPPSDGLTTGALQGSGYQLSEEELKFDCKKLTGTMQIRILQMRGYDTNKKTSTVARSLQSLTTPIFGGTKEGVDPDGQYLKDRAMLEAYNRQLGVKQCKTFDLDAELAIKSTDVTPTPR